MLKRSRTPPTIWIIQEKNRRRRGGWTAWDYLDTALSAEEADQQLKFWKTQHGEFRAVAYDKRMLGKQVRT